MSAANTVRNILPSGGFTSLRQLKLLDLIAEMGGSERRSIPVAEISAEAEISATTVSSAQGFLRQAGLLETHHGALAVTPSGLQLTRLRAEDSARARLFLSNLWRSTWFAKSATRFLRQGPLERTALAEKLGQGLSSTRERGLYLVDWLDYALIVHVAEGGLVHLSDSSPAAEAPTSSLPLTSIEEVLALPDDTFVAVMRAYTTLLTSLRGTTPRA
ncbi:hypothetical protein GCM10012285_67070 [Streptomyces kronopolitis]|uniref:MarR family transcriptional regulator n=1 Tax=Streptomyces kronopolitis TaxID=1612435 RepID=A0ABQ2K1V1_9ACTN|nr:hypothetical protein [Streptomyces kronopolitis]GGN64769.1 hypothetical protein GCM10012285_67070 [Streptomyces kronopolitis]